MDSRRFAQAPIDDKWERQMTNLNFSKVDFGGCFAGQVALVTGGASGMARAEARLMAAQGAKVAIFDINADGAAETAAMIRAEGGEATAWTVDCTKADVVEASLAEATALYGPVNHLFNTAGTVIVMRRPKTNTTGS